MTSKTKTALLAKLKEMKSYPAPEEMAAILAATIEVLPDELFADSGKTEKTEKTKAKSKS